jgi:hypothetical protein
MRRYQAHQSGAGLARIIEDTAASRKTEPRIDVPSYNAWAAWTNSRLLSYLRKLAWLHQVSGTFLPK